MSLIVESSEIRVTFPNVTEIVFDNDSEEFPVLELHYLVYPVVL